MTTLGDSKRAAPGVAYRRIYDIEVTEMLDQRDRDAENLKDPSTEKLTHRENGLTET